MKKRTFGILFFLLIAIVGIVTLPYKWSFVFYEQRNTSPIAYLPLENDESFQIRYTHSIHLSDVLETYLITKEKDIRVYGVEYEDFAIGMPSNAGEGETFVEKDGKYVITGMKTVIPSFDILVGDVDRDLYFLYNGYEHNMKDFLVRGNTYTLQLDKLSLFDQWKGENMHGGEQKSAS
ncbi:DUF1850 domain-containing protein [Paenisporosarcina cavernae]|uniref:DUF1850 domain-containing protein n=1 Tax=Paenisporosarcina cavernae TaxID=2320858 RepID=A0A385YRD6_9BACL|nr:DUF1850 domain-containing protein [Paenisporosarcina cavernae]AYC29044.1 DUF1850 domain-containing protein [Paenisporosarcina cavernae]